MRGAAGRFWTSLQPQMWGDGPQLRPRKTHKVRRQSGNSGSRREKEEERRQGAEQLSAEEEERPLYLPTPFFMASAEEE
jgi:hypothetical protein